MLLITKKTTRADLCREIQTLQVASLNQDGEIEGLKHSLSEANDRADHAERKLEARDTDVANLLGTIRVLSDPARRLRIRTSSIVGAGLSTALSSHNTDKL